MEGQTTTSRVGNSLSYFKDSDYQVIMGVWTDGLIIVRPRDASNLTELNDFKTLSFLTAIALISSPLSS